MPRSIGAALESLWTPGVDAPATDLQREATEPADATGLGSLDCLTGGAGGSLIAGGEPLLLMPLLMEAMRAGSGGAAIATLDGWRRTAMDSGIDGAAGSKCIWTASSTPVKVRRSRRLGGLQRELHVRRAGTASSIRRRARCATTRPSSCVRRQLQKRVHLPRGVHLRVVPRASLHALPRRAEVDRRRPGLRGERHARRSYRLR